MKRIFFLYSIFILCSITCFSATIKSQNLGGEWSDSGSWQGPSAPMGGDSVVIQSGHTITITNKTLIFNGKITILGSLSLVRTCGFCPLTRLISVSFHRCN